MKKHLTVISVYAFIIMAILLYSVYAFFMCHTVTMDSDYGSLVLEANDILNGNLLRSGWDLTGVSFLLTDVPYFCIGVLISGVSEEAYIIAVTLMAIMLMISSFFLLSTDQEDVYSLGKLHFLVPVLDMLFLFALAGPLNDYNVSILRSHTGSVILAFFGLAFFAYQYTKQKGESVKLSGYIPSFILFACSFTSDAVGFLIVIASIIFWLLCRIVPELYHKRKPASKDIYGVTICIGSVLAGYIFNKLYFLAGTANNNEIEVKSFISLKDLSNHCSSLFETIFHMNDITFFGNPVFELHTIISFMQVILFILAFILMVYNIWKMITGKDPDFISSVLSCGAILILTVCILTNFWENPDYSRYFASLPAINAILIIRFLKLKFFTHQHDCLKNSVCIAAAFFIFFSGLSRFSTIRHYTPVIDEKEGLAVFLKENGLEYGYSGFWNASSITVLSNNNVHVASILYDGNTLKPLMWFCKEEWYTYEATFIITPEAYWGITTEDVLSELGEPNRYLYYNDYVIMVYDTQTIKQYTDSANWPALIEIPYSNIN